MVQFRHPYRLCLQYLLRNYNTSGKKVLYLRHGHRNLYNVCFFRNNDNLLNLKIDRVIYSKVILNMEFTETH